jgi:uncharacterized protein YecA (UPF0149 family)
MKTETAQIRSITDAPKMIHGIKVWPMALGHLTWLNQRKNKFITEGKTDDFTLAELCFCFTVHPAEIKTYQGAKATKQIEEFADCCSVQKLTALYNHAVEQLLIHIKTISHPKKAQAAKGRKKIKA